MDFIEASGLTKFTCPTCEMVWESETVIICYGPPAEPHEATTTERQWITVTTAIGGRTYYIEVPA